MKHRTGLWLTVLGVLLLIPGAASAQVTVDCNAGGILQTAVNAAQPGTTILVLGVCNENVRVNDEKPESPSMGRVQRPSTVPTPHRTPSSSQGGILRFEASRSRVGVTASPC